MFSLSSMIQRYTHNSNLLYHLRILIALAGAAAVPWWLGIEKLTIPLTLGVVAAALTDLDDRLAGRLRNLLITLICFFIASASTELLFPYPWLFTVGLTTSTCVFILLGALGPRYATIAFGALLIAVYTMLGASMYDVWYQQPTLLIIGALWYNLLTLIGHLLLPIKPLQENLARCYDKLANYLDAKAMLFDPDAEQSTDLPWVDVAMANSVLVTTLNQTKNSLLTRLKGDRGQRGTRRTLHYYFVVQDIHERASSSHVLYEALSKQFRHSDILFRFQRLLTLQASACRQLAQSFLLQQKYLHNSRFESVFQRIEEALAQVTASAKMPEQARALLHLLKNLRAIDAQLANIESEQLLSYRQNRQMQNGHLEENSLSDEKLTGWYDIRLRISAHFTPQSALFRHAIRMSLVLCIGYALIQFTGIQHGYWILLTSLFVCQPNYNATRRRLALRIIGTLAGIFIGLPILYFVPSLEGQMILIVISGVLFFAFRTVQYAHATMFITLLVLLCFNLLGEGFDVAAPRIYDTLLGCAIAWAAVNYIWPDWKFRQLSTVVSNTLNAECRYLDAIMLQYHQGKDNGLPYRVARRDAHNSDAELASVVSNMSADPKTDVALQEAAFRLLCLNHTLLSYISALGAHREYLTNTAVLGVLNDAVCYIDDALNHNNGQTHQHVQQALSVRIERLAPEPESKDQLVLQQIGLMLALLPELTMLSTHISQ